MGLTKGPRTSAGPDAGTVLQLAVLLQAGLPPEQAWRHLAETDATARAVVAGLDATAAGAPPERLVAAIAAAGSGWAEVARAWSVATAVGAPLADSLRGMASALRDAAEVRDEVRVVLAEPAATARLLTWLPLVGMLLGTALGVDSLTTLVTTPPGVSCLVGGLALLVVARWWTATLVRRAQPRERVPGLRAELLAVAVSGGVSLERAREIVSTTAADDATLSPREADARGEAAETERVLELSRSAGVPAAELLRAAAALARQRARTAGRLSASRLATRLLLPLGVCTLPAFLLLGVAPMLLGLLSSTALL
jgi:tight adherence protein B